MRLAVLALLALSALRPAAAQTSPAARAALAEVRAAAVVTAESRSGRSGLTYVWLRPAVAGVEVMDDPALVVLGDAGAVVFTRGEIAGGTVESDTDILGPDAAVERAAAASGIAARGASGLAPQARRVFVRTDAGALRLAYEVALYPADAARWAVVRIDAATGAVLSERRLAVFENADGDVPFLPEARPEARGAPFAGAQPSDGASYRVVAPPSRSPLDGGRALVTGPADALASPYGWHDTDGVAGPEFTTTRGNNAHAFPDRDFNGQPDAAGVPDGGARLVFDFPLDLTAGPEASREAATTNAFFWVNHVHDVFYPYGFDEAGGNFQANAYGRGGVDGADPVSVRVQSGGGLDNAYMVVPSDGFPPVLTLFESTRTSPRRDYALDAEVVAHEITHGLTARLTGGPADTACLSTGGEDMAEGWSDWFALMLTMRPGETRADARRYGAYTGGPDVRIRPYATDFAVNDLTYGSTVGMTARHAIGAVWATVLWEIAWDLIDAHGFSPDFTNARGAAGNQIAMSLVVEALRLQPCRPGFVDARNAILLADQVLYQNAHYALLQAAFARRGLGRGAAQGAVTATADNIASFEVETDPIDVTPPAAPANLVATVERPGEVRLRFTAPGDDGTVGQAARYDVRVSVQPITTPTEFEAAGREPDVLPPSPAGQTDVVALRRLGFRRQYAVAVRAIDQAGNVSAIASTSFVSGENPSYPPPPSPITFTQDTVVVHVVRGGAGTGAATFHNADTIGRFVRAWAGGRGGFPHLTAHVSTDDPATPYPTLGPGGGPVTAWLPTAPGVDPLDAGYIDLALPFAFPYDGYTYDTIRAYTDGFLSFYLESSALPPTRTLSAALPTAIIAPYWADLAVGGGGVYSGRLADGRFAVEYRQVRAADDPTGAPVSFLVALAPSGEIALAYDRTAPGVDAIRGVRGVIGSYTLLQLHAPARDRSIDVFVPPGALLSVLEPSVIVPAGGTASLTVRAAIPVRYPARYEGLLFLVRQPDEYETPAQAPLVIDVVDGVTASPPPPDVPASRWVELRAARPNPARGRTAVTFGLPAALPVRLAVYDARGREVAVLAEGAFEAGLHDATWDAGAAAPGLYVVRLVAGGETRTVTVVVVR